MFLATYSSRYGLLFTSGMYTDSVLFSVVVQCKLQDMKVDAFNLQDDVKSP